MVARHVNAKESSTDGYRPQRVRSVALGLLAAAICVFTTDAAAADPVDDRSREARALFGTHQWREGIAILVDLYEDAPNPEYLYEISLAYEHLPGRCRDSVRYYDRFLEACGRCGRHALAKERRILVSLGCPGVPDSAEHKTGTDFSEPLLIEGWASLAEGPNRARDAAVADALRRAVGQVAGVRLAVQMTDVSVSQIRNGREEFLQRVDYHVATNYSGFVESYVIEDEQIDGDLLRVLIRAKVAPSLLDRAIEQLARVGDPTLRVRVVETYVDASGQEKVMPHSRLEAVLGQLLVERGFRVIKEANRAPDYLVNAEARIIHTGTRHGGRHFGEVQMTMSAEEAASGRTIVSVSLPRSPAPPGARTEGHLRESAIDRHTPALADDFSDRLLKAMLSERIYVVELTDPRANPEARRRFSDALGRLPGVGRVTTNALTPRVLTTELRFPAELDVNTLAELILDAIRPIESLADVRLTQIEGRRLVFSFASRSGHD